MDNITLLDMDFEYRDTVFDSEGVLERLLKRRMPPIRSVGKESAEKISMALGLQMRKVVQAPSTLRATFELKALLCLPKLCIRLENGDSNPGSSLGSQRYISNAWLDTAIDSNWEVLFDNLPSESTDNRFCTASSTKLNRAKHASSSSIIQKATRQALDGDMARAIQTLQKKDLASTYDPIVIANLRSLHPQAYTPPRGKLYEIETLPPAFIISDNDVEKALSKFHAYSSSGPDGFLPCLLREAYHSTDEDIDYGGFDLRSNLHKFLQHYIGGKLPVAVASYMASANLVAVDEGTSRVSEKLRPITIGNAYRRLAGRILADKVFQDGSFKGALNKQLAVGVQGGLEAGLHSIRHVVRTLGHDGRYILLSVDFSNAFNSCSRRAFLDSVIHNAPGLARFVHYTYSEPSPLYTSSETIMSREGTQQGDSLGILLFCLALQPVIDKIETRYGHLLPLHLWYADDGTLVVPVSIARELLILLQRECTRIGLTISRQKLTAWWPTMKSKLLTSLPCDLQWECSRTPLPGIVVCGVAIGTERFESDYFDFRASEVIDIVDRIKLIENPHIAYQLHLNCASHANIMLLLRCQNPLSFRRAAQRFDSVIVAEFAALQRISRDALRPGLTARQIMHLPLRKNGLGFLSAHDIRHAAFIGSVVDSMELVCQLIPNAPLYALHSVLNPVVKDLHASVADISDSAKHLIHNLLSRSKKLTREQQKPRTQSFLLEKIHSVLYNNMLKSTKLSKNQWKRILRKARKITTFATHSEQRPTETEWRRMLRHCLLLDEIPAIDSKSTHRRLPRDTQGLKRVARGRVSKSYGTRGDHNSAHQIREARRSSFDNVRPDRPIRGNRKRGRPQERLDRTCGRKRFTW